MNAATARTAAGEDMPALNRRRLLIGLAAASTAAAAPALSAAPSISRIAENPELIRVGDDVSAALDAYLTARDFYARTVKEGRRRWPKTPEELFRRDGDGGGYLFAHGYSSGEIERDFKGGRAWRKNEKEPRVVLSQSEATWRYRAARDALANKSLLRRGKLHGRTRAEWERHLAEAKPLAELAEAYYGECKRIREDLKWDTVWRDASAKATALGDILTKITEAEARTMEGVLIKAQALTAWSEVDGTSRMFHPGQPDWGPKFAADVIRLAEARQSA